MRRRMLSNSELKTFTRCPRKWWLGYYRGLVPVREETLGNRALGSKVHLALARWMSEGTDPLEVLREKYDETRQDTDETSEEVAKEEELAFAMVEGYLNWLSETGYDENLEVVGTEYELERPMGFNWHDGRDVVLVGKLDRLVRDLATGALAILDYKTVGNLTDLPKMMYTDPQFLTYTLLTRELEPDNWVSGVIVDQLRKVKRTANAKPPFYSRESVWFNDTYLERFDERVRTVAEQINIVEKKLDLGFSPMKAGLFPHHDRDCTYACDFWGICPGFDDGSDPEYVIKRSFRERDPYERYEEIQT